MSLKQHIAELYAYNRWANSLILDTAVQLSVEQMRSLPEGSPDSPHNILVHAMSAEWVWRLRVQQDGVSPPGLFDPTTFADLAAIRTRWNEEAELMRHYLDTLTESDLAGSVSYHTTSGKIHSQPLAGILQHVVLHGMQHRSEMAVILTNYGYSPGNIDLIIYLRR